MTVAVPVRESRRLAGSGRPRLQLSAEFQLFVGDRPISLPHSVERIVAFLAVTRVPITRDRLAASLWPEVGDRRAKGDLRSGLWRLRRLTGVISEQDRRLALAPDVHVDIAELNDLTRALIDRPDRPTLSRLPDLVRGPDILPGWDEEWLVVERERYAVRRAQALERSGEVLLDQGDLVAALDAALACVQSEPYRESAQRLVMRIHLANGNYADAIRTYEAYRRLIAEELGIRPSPLMNELLASVPRRSSDDGALTPL